MCCYFTRAKLRLRNFSLLQTSLLKNADKKCVAFWNFPDFQGILKFSVNGPESSLSGTFEPLKYEASRVGDLFIGVFGSLRLDRQDDLLEQDASTVKWPVCYGNLTIC